MSEKKKFERIQVTESFDDDEEFQQQLAEATKGSAALNDEDYAKRLQHELNLVSNSNLYFVRIPICDLPFFTKSL